MTWRVRYGSKYGAKKQEHDGILYHSKKEARFAAELGWKKIAKEIKDWERQVKISLDVNGYHICNYYCDFKVIHNDGSIELVEVKGFSTDVFRLKWKLLEAIYSVQHPEIRLTMIR